MPRSSFAPATGVHEITRDILLLLLNQRSELPHAANGKPAAPSDPSAAQILKDMGQGKSQEIARLLTVLTCNARDGVAPEIIKLVSRRIDAAVDAAARASGPRPLSAINRRETREECLLNLTQLRAEADHDDAEALRALAEQCAHYRDALDELQREAERRLTWLLGVDQFAPSRPQLVRVK